MNAVSLPKSLAFVRLVFVTATAVIFLAMVTPNCAPVYADNSPADFSSLLRLGGDTSVVLNTPTAMAYRFPAQNLNDSQVDRHLAGDRLFDGKFSEDSGHKNYGLGPAYNHVSCMGCHVSDGRGALPLLRGSDGGEWTKINVAAAIFLRTSLEDVAPRRFDSTDRWGAPIPVPGYGTQIFHLGSFGLRPDLPGTGVSQVYMKIETSDFQYPDGQVVQLRKPIFRVENPYDLDGLDQLHQPDVRFSPRMTPAMIGLGLLEAIPERDILVLEARDLSAWRIRGRANWVLDRTKEIELHPRPVSLGRFGLKANTPSVLHQSLAALNGDLGVTNPAFPLENIGETPLFKIFAPDWKQNIEASADSSDAIVFYSQTLAVPTRRNITDPEVRTGAKKFMQVGCAHCHHPSFVTGEHPIAALANQTIYPFTDMLLHDMGDGLADNRSDFYASGRDWRTPPLWGIGLAQVVNNRAGFLHDGRARTLEEAILWHAGEAELSREKFTLLPSTDRTALIQFLRSL